MKYHEGRLHLWWVLVAWLVGSLLTANAITAAAVQQSWQLEFELGSVWTGRNDVRIPNVARATRFSLDDELASTRSLAYRIRLTYALSNRSTLSALIAPLRIDVEGRSARALNFADVTFPAATSLTGQYRFDSYRLTYRYDDIRSDRFLLGYGFTAKIRDATVGLTGDGRTARKHNLGFVPLLHFRLLWRFVPPVGLLLEGDALAASQGRAEDVLLALRWWVSPELSTWVGYRVLEGGADVEEAYTFALLHYLTAGVTLRY